MPTDLLLAITESTCGEACWEAREDVCRCSCGGKNHGVFRATGTRPNRTAKIDSYVYRLAAVGNHDEIHFQADGINGAAGYRKISGLYHYTWSETDKGAPARVKPASKDQIERWAELTSYKENPPAAYEWRKRAHLLWVREGK